MATATPFDLDAYIKKYKGHTVNQRLLFIAEKAKDVKTPASRELALAACERLLKNVKTSSGMNIEAYESALAVANSCEAGDGSTASNNSNGVFVRDEDWVTKAQNRGNELQAQLEHDLEMFKSNMIKESIRMGHSDLASFHVQKGDLKTALSYHLKNRDYCTTRKHVFDMCLNIISVALHLGNYPLVQSQAIKGQHVPSVQDETIGNLDRGKLDVAIGLASLSKKDYKQAAESFLKVPHGIGNSFSSILHIEDVIVYITLCALATFDRAMLKNKILDNENARNMLELVPAMRELVNDFYAGKYGPCLAFLDSYRHRLNLDLYFSDHVNDIIQKINENSILQYFSAFVSVKLPVMATALNLPVEKLETDIAKLIEGGKLNGKIDCDLKILQAKTSNQRRQAFENAIDAGEQFIAEANLAMLRMNIAKHRFVHDDPGRSSMWGKMAQASSSAPDGNEGKNEQSNESTPGRGTEFSYDCLDDIRSIISSRSTEEKSNAPMSDKK